MHPNTEAILRHFDHAHLPPHLAVISRPCRQLADDMAERLDGPELTAGLRHLLEAKDCFVRAAVEQHRAIEEATPRCGRCRVPFDPADKRFDGHAQFHDTGYCGGCISSCHEADGWHSCVICTPKPEADDDGTAEVLADEHRAASDHDEHARDYDAEGNEL